MADDLIIGLVPELPDLTVYIETLAARIVGQRLVALKVRDPFVLRTALPPVSAAEGRTVSAVERIGKRIVIALAGGPYLVLHLMVAGRLHWMENRGRSPIKALVLLEFDNGTLAFTEAGKKRRASLHLVESLEGIDPGGIEPLEATLEEFETRLRSQNHTLKRALTDPKLLAGIGNAYSDEILHRARLSPVALTAKLDDTEVERLHEAVRAVLAEWTRRLRAEAAGALPEKVTAFREGMAVHGRYGKPCPDCGSPVQRIVYAENETNYCARCQTGGRILADRALSRLLKASWPRSIEELE